jgi:sphingomyelin phosphodiesterase acid-like 3
MKRFLAALILLAFLWPTRPFTPRGSLSAQQRHQEVTLSVEQNQGTFLMLSDIHFNPLADDIDPKVFARLNSRPARDWQAIFQAAQKTPIARDGEDANYALLVSALDAAKSSGQKYDYILVMGDFLTHKFSQQYAVYRPDGNGYEDFATKTMVFVSQMIQQAFPSVPIYNAFGNNDSTTGDYMAPGSALLGTLAKEWKTVAADRDAVRDFLSGGYYEVRHPTAPNSEFIILNSTFFSRHYDMPSIAQGDRGRNELDWLDSKLKKAEEQHKSAVLIMHIPPGMDVFESAKSGACDNPTIFWKRPYLDSFLRIINSHLSALRDSYAGHTHTDDFRIFSDAGGSPFLQMHIVASISRDHHNNPAFEIGVYDKTSGALVDYEVVALKNAPGAAGEAAQPSWKPAYDFRQESAQEYGPATLQALSDIIRSNDSLRRRYMDFYKAEMSAGAPVNNANWRFYSCGETEMTPENYQGCACPAR